RAGVQGGERTRALGRLSPLGGRGRPAGPGPPHSPDARTKTWPTAAGGTAVSPCVSPEQFRRLLAEQLSAAERQALEAHVEACPECQQRLARLLDEADGGPADVDWQLLLHCRPQPTPQTGETFLERLRKTPQPGTQAFPEARARGEPGPLHFPAPPPPRGPP